MRHISYIITGLTMIFPMTAIAAFAKPDWLIGTGVQSGAGIVMSMDPGAVLFTQNIREQRIPASIIKLLTTLVVIENTNDLGASVTFSRDTIYSVESGVGNEFGLEEGDVLSVRQCLYAILLQSSSQSANALTEHVASSRQAFVDMMNQRIKELGCNENHFVNPSDLNDDTQRTTAYDMAIIARARFQNPTVLEITSARTSSIPATTNSPNKRTFSIGHKILLSDDSNYCPDAIADKTGWTSQAGQTLVTYVRREGGDQTVVTLMNTQKAHYSNTKTILNFCFAKFKSVSIADSEIKYITGSASMTVRAETYNPPELSVDSGTVITIPNNTQSTNANKTFETDLLEDHPQEAVVRLVYAYNERRVGDAWICSSSAQAIDATPSGPGGDTPPESRPAEDGRERNIGFTLPRAVLIGGGAILALALLADDRIFWFKRRQAAEREHQRILREKRRRRLADIGCTEEDFERLLDERREQYDIRWSALCDG